MVHFADPKFVSEPGSDLKPTYIPKVDARGVISLIQDGFENIFDYIQSFRDSTDIDTIVRRVAAGETDLLMKRPGSFGDFTKMPKTYAEMLQLQIDSRRTFDSLPTDIKQKFGNDPNQFFAQSGTEQWYKNLEPVLPDEVKATIFPEVKVDEP